MNKLAAPLIAVLVCSVALAGDEGYLMFNDKGQLVVSGPFNVIIPAPPESRPAGPIHANPQFLDESLHVSRAGFFRDDEFVVIEVETTDAPAGTLSYEGRLPTIELGGVTFYTRALCIEFTQEEVDAGNDPLRDFVKSQNIRLVPGVYARQLFVTTQDGTGEGVILYAQSLDSCELATDEFASEFDQRFERFIESVERVNPTS